MSVYRRQMGLESKSLRFVKNQGVNDQDLPSLVESPHDGLDQSDSEIHVGDFMVQITVLR